LTGFGGKILKSKNIDNFVLDKVTFSLSERLSESVEITIHCVEANSVGNGNGCNGRGWGELLN